ncbi:hypothetical protein FB451DRAFT_1558225 [Mycena latifolia]|nr:hypothetical protein FB451DRAFT_1558225 [Mycena latifolia]
MLPMAGIHIIYDMSRENLFIFYALSNPWVTTSLIMIESSLLQTTMTVCILVSFRIGLLVQMVLTALQPVVFGISVVLIHARIGLGWAEEAGGRFGAGKSGCLLDVGSVLQNVFRTPRCVSATV